MKCLDLLALGLPFWLAGTNLYWGYWCWGAWCHGAWCLGAWCHGAWYWGAWCLGAFCWARGLVPKFACLGTSFLTFDLCALKGEHWGRTCLLRPQWWHMGGRLMVGSFLVYGISSLIMSFPLSTTVSGGSGTVGLTKIVLEVEGMSEGGAIYPSPVLSVELF